MTLIDAPEQPGHHTTEQRLLDGRGEHWLWILPLNSWVCDTGTRYLLRDRSGVETEFGPTREAPAGGEQPGRIEAQPPVHGTTGTQVSPAGVDQQGSDRATGDG